MCRSRPFLLYADGRPCCDCRVVSPQGIACVLVIVGAVVFAVIMAMVVSVIKAVESKGAALRALLKQTTDFTKSRHISASLARKLERFVELQWQVTAGLDSGEVDGRTATAALPSRP